MPARENPNLEAPRENSRKAQAERYDNLAHFMWKLTTVNGKHQYPEAGLRRLLTGARVLTRDGHVNHQRLDRLARSLGIHDQKVVSDLPDVFYDDDDVWDDILEGVS